MNKSSFHVLIAGGGLGGLCLAQGLKKAGVSVAVYERDRTRTDRLQGYRIHIDPNGSRALHQSLPDHLFRIFNSTGGVATRGFNIINHRLNELLHIDLASLPIPDPIARHRSVSRITLRQVLLDGLDDNVHFDKRFVRYEETSDGRVIAYFEDGTSAVGDLLVGADGGNSKVREQFLPHAKRVETGVVGIAGKVPLTDETRSWLPRPMLDGIASVSAPHGQFMFCASMMYPKQAPGAGEIGGPDAAEGLHPGLLFDNTQDYIFWAFSARRSAYPADADLREGDGEALRKVVLGMIADWHPQFHRLVRAADASTIAALTIRTSEPVTPWPTRNITLLGDAIHSMTPYRGIGANVALRDAALLSRNLAAAHRGEMAFLDAIHAYESEMLVYGFDAVRTSLKALEQAHADSRVGKMIASLVFKVLNRVPPLKRRVILGND
jgi:2-polyprenyl-6-methoxyphenol hydroxylase-like FAD-dependent oxidoreductase